LQDGEAVWPQDPVDLRHGCPVIDHVFENVTAEDDVKRAGRVGNSGDIHPDSYARLIEIGSQVSGSDKSPEHPLEARLRSDMEHVSVAVRKEIGLVGQVEVEKSLPSVRMAARAEGIHRAVTASWAIPRERPRAHCRRQEASERPSAEGTLHTVSEVHEQQRIVLELLGHCVAQEPVLQRDGALEEILQ